MFLEIENVLTADEIARLRQIAAEAAFVDGRVSNPHSKVKNNLQADTATQTHQESSRLVAQALLRNERFRNYAFPKLVANPLLCKYEPGMSYGGHPDSALLPMKPDPLRSDVSCTVWISEPDDCDGGDLRIHFGSKHIDVKGPAGSIILYPSTTIHEVLEVKSGQRLVAITFIQSQIQDAVHRDLLYELNEVAALEGYNMDDKNRTRLEYVRQSLQRLWSIP